MSNRVPRLPLILIKAKCLVIYGGGIHIIRQTAKSEERTFYRASPAGRRNHANVYNRFIDSDSYLRHALRQLKKLDSARFSLIGQCAGFPIITYF